MTTKAVSDPETARLTSMKKGDISKFIEDFHQTVRDAREAFADVSPVELQRMIDEAVEDARANHCRERALPT